MSSTHAGTSANGGCFTLLNRSREHADNARHDETLLEQVEQLGPVAAIWETRRSLVVPRSYRRHATFDETCARFAREGWPVTVRQTGGGIVPQGPGILNLSLAYAVQGPPMQHSQAGYELICAVLATAMTELGIEAFAAAVDGSFCDGRYNLAVRRDGGMVKIAGTAQTWRRAPGSMERHLGLVHALVLLDVDTDEVTRTANAFEAALGSAQRYRPDRVVSAAALAGRHPGLQARYRQALESALAQARAPVCPATAT